MFPYHLNLAGVGLLIYAILASDVYNLIEVCTSCASIAKYGLKILCGSSQFSEWQSKLKVIRKFGGKGTFCQEKNPAHVDGQNSFFFSQMGANRATVAEQQGKYPVMTTTKWFEAHPFFFKLIKAHSPNHVTSTDSTPKFVNSQIQVHLCQVGMNQKEAITRSKCVVFSHLDPFLFSELVCPA